MRGWGDAGGYIRLQRGGPRLSKLRWVGPEMEQESPLVKEGPAPPLAAVMENAGVCISAESRCFCFTPGVPGPDDHISLPGLEAFATWLFPPQLAGRACSGQVR